MSAEFVWKMEDVLDLYSQPYDPCYPQVCFDERRGSKASQSSLDDDLRVRAAQLLSEKRVPLPSQPRQLERYDYEYKREGTCNLFAFFQPWAGWRHIKVTSQRTAIDFAHCMKDLVDEYFPKATKVKVVLDNLNTHTPASLYKAFSPKEAKRILDRLEFHYTPKHGSW